MLNDEETTGVVPITDDNIKTGISIEPKEVHEYTLKITFIETGKVQNYNQGKEFSAKININDGHNSDVQIALKVNGQVVDELPEDKYYRLDSFECDNGSIVTWNIFKQSYNIEGKKKESCTLNFSVPDTLYSRIVADNVIYNDNENSEFVNNTTPGIDFSAISSDTNGKGLYRTSDLTKTEDTDNDGKGEEVLYFRGAVTNNYLVFAGFCWRIVRTNEDGSIKLRYGGTPTTSNGVTTCPETGTSVYINNTHYPFNSKNNLAKYSQYVYDTNTSSTAKSTIDTWYENNIANKGEYVTSLIVDTPYCNDMSVAYVSSGNTYYGPFARIENNKNPQYKCPQANDRYIKH